MLDLRTEQIYWLRGYRIIGAIDEAGRGPLAGPVVAACVLVPADFTMPDSLAGVKDSKKLTAKKREELYDEIMDAFAEVGVGICDHAAIDRINILEATFLAMKKALGTLRRKPDIALIDGNRPIPNSSLVQKPIVKGDARVFSIAAASIIAKVTRDRLMLAFHERYPKYGFDKHKGYGTKQHLECLEKYGPCEIHRKSFAPVKKHMAHIT